MNEINLDPPSPPQPQGKDTITFSKKNLAIVFLGFAITILTLVILIPSSDSSKTSDTVPQRDNTPAPAYSVPSEPVTNKYDDYMNHVLNNSGQANTWSKAQIIEFGDLVCQALDNGNSIRSVVSLLEGYTKTTSDAELFASVMIGSIKYLCPEYMSDLNYYLNS